MTSAYGAALQLWTYVQMPAMAVGAACSSMAAQNVGAGRWERVDATARTGVLFNFLLTGALIAPIVVFDRHTLALFLPEASLALENARHLNHIAVWSFLFFGVTFVVSGVVRSTGAVLPPLLILGIALWGIRVPFASLLQPTLGCSPRLARMRSGGASRSARSARWRCRWPTTAGAAGARPACCPAIRARWRSRPRSRRSRHRRWPTSASSRHPGSSRAAAPETQTAALRRPLRMTRCPAYSAAAAAAALALACADRSSLMRAFLPSRPRR